MTNYVKATNFASKDALPPGDAQKKVKGAEINTEFDAIATAIESKANKNSPALEGTPTAPTASAATNTTQIATTAFVQDQKASPALHLQRQLLQTQRRLQLRRLYSKRLLLMHTQSLTQVKHKKV